MRRMTREELATALITMYSECHALEEAIALFQKFSQRHLQSKEGGIGVWSAMIAAFVNQELVNEALKIVSTMKEVHGVEPDIQHHC